MKHILIIFVGFLSLTGCNEEAKNVFNMDAEPLSTNAEMKASSWVGYNDFADELRDLTDNFSQQNLISKNKQLLSKAQAILYSMPNDIRNEITNEKASELVELTKTMLRSLDSKSEEAVKEDLKNVVKAFTTLNGVLNEYSE